MMLERFFMKISNFRKIEEQYCADPRQTNRSEVFSQDTLTRTLQRGEGMLWKDLESDPYHNRQFRQNNLPNHFAKTPPQLEKLSNYGSPSPNRSDRFSRSSGSGEDFRNFHEQPPARNFPQRNFQQMSPNQDQSGSKRFRR